MSVLDGRSKFGCSLLDFYRQPFIVSQVAGRFGVLIPLPSDVAEDAAPALARVDVYQRVARWIADCPACGFGRACMYVWLEGPLAMFCVACGNADIGHRWRSVLVPTNYREIERMLLARADPTTRNWLPGESMDELLSENVMLAGGGG